MPPSSQGRAGRGGWIVALATLGPVGRKLPAPGTWGSLAGLLYFTVFFSRMTVFENLVASAVGFVVAALVCGLAEVRMGRTDPGEVILDEFVAMPLCFLGWPMLVQRWPVWAVLLGGFALFRLFDIVKPFGIRRLQAVRGGWGVAIDDTAAALVACASLHLAVRLLAVR
ncbi:phosphatidylglycerophosphatase A [Opitutus sp. ER46]|uniref:phosphatidylglycerophosphatase A family protein n=1 Tax=Opitutus sp. ER46 TaxID=2161864 RepID=UPI000D32090C|nr:phosphatidylglycerophosphatase A [Opitutus sp. ER46]PTX94553.1 phosphatidylglycerophosphatase A [Opitutus sp. ER46]